MALNKTGYTEKSAENFIIDAATIFTDFKVEGDEFTGTPLGATRGGTEININLTYRKIEVDGTSVMDVKGLNVLESGTASVKVTLLELTAENLARSMNAELKPADALEAPTGYQVITPKRYLADTDYIKNIAIVGIHSGTKKPVIFALDNGLIKSPMNLKMEDNNEAGIEQEITANASYEQLIKDEFPWRIYHPTAAPVGGTAAPVGGGE